MGCPAGSFQMGRDELGVCVDAASSFRGCGGDVVGEWKLHDSCTSKVADACWTSWKLESRPVPTVTFKADGTSVNTVMGHLEMKTATTLACEKVESCAELNGDSFGVTMSCVAKDTSACACTTTADITSTSNETYTIAGTKITHGSESNKRTDPYCVDGDLLYVAADNGQYVTIAAYERVK